MKRIFTDEAATKQWAAQLGRAMRGGEVLELIGDVGAGKTTFTKGLASGMSITETVQSPSFTISRNYENANGLRLAHYDFYRLDDAGIMAQELQETSDDPHTVTVIEWADAVTHVLPEDRLQFVFRTLEEGSREVELRAFGQRSRQIVEQLS